MNRPMKQFDLQAAMRGEPIVTRAGEPVQFIAYAPRAVPHQQLVTQLGAGIILTGIDGKFWGSGGKSPLDLFMAPCARHCEARGTAQATPSETHVIAITVAYEQGVGKGQQAHHTSSEIANPYDNAWNCDYAWGLGYKEGKLQASRTVQAGQAIRCEEKLQSGWSKDCNPDNCTGCATPAAPAQADEREAFETWVAASGRAHVLTRDDRNDWYADLTVTAWWTAWQARAAQEGK